MPTLQDREHFFEEQYAQEQDRVFELRARRNRLFGLWAASHMGLRGHTAERYSLDLVELGVHMPDEALIERVRSDLLAVGIAETGEKLGAELKFCAAKANIHVSSTTKS